MDVAGSIGFLLLCVAPASAAQSPFSARVAPAPMPPPVTAAAYASSFGTGVDDCASPHTDLGTGEVFDVPYTTGTTGSTGQNETDCVIFGRSGISNDVWFDWTADATATARLTNCGDAVDTRIAVYPHSTCPADGTALQCRDNGCVLQTTVPWAAVSGTTYTIQLGTFPGAPGGSGNFSITLAGVPPCGRHDDGTSENSLGLTMGGEIGWLSAWEFGGETCFQYFNYVNSAYGTATFPGSIMNGSASRVAVYRDADEDDDPTTGLTLVASANTVVQNANTDILNQVYIGPCIHTPVSGRLWTLVTADHAPGEFPAPMDQTPPTNTAGTWVVGSTLGPGTLNVDDLSANDIAPLNMAAIGFPANWLMRPGDICDYFVFLPSCFGDGGGADCPCGNSAGVNQGCANGTGAGATLAGLGFPSVTNDTMSLRANGVINDSGLFFQGNNAVAGGEGVAFGDGLRCCGGNVVRLQVVNPPGTASPTTAQMTETVTTNGPPGTIVPGTSKCYQYWYRDPQTSPCGTGFNLSNLVYTTWFP